MQLVMPSAMGGASLKRQPMGVLSESWLGRTHAQWAHDYDANIAQLDFDDDEFGTASIGHVFDADDSAKLWPPTSAMLDLNSNSPTTVDNALPRQAARATVLAQHAIMRNSLSLSSAESLFTSIVEALPVEGAMGHSTDSLEGSEIDSEHLRQVCAIGNAANYCLTFSRMADSTSMMAPSHMAGVHEIDNYADAPLSDVRDRLRDCAHLNTQSSALPLGAELTTWGRIRRSCDNVVNERPRTVGAMPQGTEGGTAYYAQLLREQGAGEHLTSNTATMETTADSPIPLFNLSASMHIKGDTPISLLNVFKAKMSSLPASPPHNDSSGYATGHECANWVEEDNQTADYEPVLTREESNDYEYAEYYMGDGRYVDVNSNEIGYSPTSTEGVQHVVEEEPRDRWRQLTPRSGAPAKPPRTFATLMRRASSMAPVGGDLRRSTCVDQAVQTSPTRSPRKECRTEAHDANRSKSVNCPPSLAFMKLSHTVPALFPQAPPFPLDFLTGAVDGEARGEQMAALLAPSHQLLDAQMAAFGGGIAGPSRMSHTPSAPQLAGLSAHFPLTQSGALLDVEHVVKMTPHGLRLPTSNAPLLATHSEHSSTSRPIARDSGLGNSGPAHIQDWDSLAALLPKDVVQACSFFKTNSELLQGRSYGATNVEKPSTHRHQARWRPPTDRRSRGPTPSTLTMSSPSPCHCQTSVCCAHSCCAHRPPPPPADRHSGLQRWHDEGVDVDDSHYARRPPMMQAYNKSLSFSSSDDDDVLVRHSECAMPSAVYSEYHLRQRDPRVNMRHFLSMHNMSTVREEEVPMTSTTRPCPTCFRLPRLDGDAPTWALPAHRQNDLCDCPLTHKTARPINSLRYYGRQRTQHSSIMMRSDGTWHRARRANRFNPEEASVRTTAVYRARRDMVDEVESACERVVDMFASLRRASTVDRRPALTAHIVTAIHQRLCESLVDLLEDGLSTSAWQLVSMATIDGPATKTVHGLVIDIKHDGSLADDGERMHEFLVGLLRLRSLDCWLSYMALKNGVLDAAYEECAFMRQALGAYRSLFERVVMAVQPLSLLPLNRVVGLFDGFASQSAYSLTPSRLPSDSRVPKSSSVPERLSMECPSTPTSVRLARHLVEKVRPIDEETMPTPPTSVEASPVKKRLATPTTTISQSSSTGSVSRIPVLSNSPSGSSVCASRSPKPPASRRVMVETGASRLRQPVVVNRIASRERR